MNIQRTKETCIDLLLSCCGVDAVELYTNDRHELYTRKSNLKK